MNAKWLFFEWLNVQTEIMKYDYHCGKSQHHILEELIVFYICILFWLSWKLTRRTSAEGHYNKDYKA